MGSWRFVAFNLNGDGTETHIGELRLSGAVATRVLSGPHQITGDIEIPRTTFPLSAIKRRKTVIYAEDPNRNIWIGGVVVDFTIDGPKLSLDAAGFVNLGKDQPFDDDVTWIGIDPFDAVRYVWGVLQSKQGGNLGLIIDSTTTPVRIGSALGADDSTNDNENVTLDSGPIKLNWWSTDDSQGQIDTLAGEVPFDYLEEHSWKADGTGVDHFLRLGYPTIGSRRNLRFVLGENVRKMPSETYSGDDVVTEVWVYGAGEGRARIRGVASIVPTDSLRSVVTIDDKSITDQGGAELRARQELQRYQPDMPGAGVTELVVTNHSNAPLGSYDVGDEIPYSGDHDWGPVAVWVKITKIAIKPDEGDVATVTVVRSDTI